MNAWESWAICMCTLASERPERVSTATLLDIYFESLEESTIDRARDLLRGRGARLAGPRTFEFTSIAQGDRSRTILGVLDD